MNKKGEVNTKVLIIILCVFVLLVGYFGYVLFFKAPTLKVPDFTTMNETEVYEWAALNKCEDKINRELTPSDDIPKGQVVRQTIKEGEKFSDIITIYISSGPAKTEIEYTSTTKREEMEAWFKEHGFTNVVYELEENEKYESGTIISVSPSKASVDEEVIVYVASNDTIKVPDFSTYTREQIESWATTNKVSVTFSNKQSSSKQGTVIEQKPKAGEILKEGDKIEISLSSGNTKTGNIPVNLLGMSETNFLAKLKELGYTNVVKDTSGFYSTINAKGTIGYYDPDGDVALNTKIIYRLSLGPYDTAFNKTDYEGKTKSEADSVVKKLNNLNAHITLNTTETKDESHKDGTLFDCTVKRSGTNSTVSCKLAKNDTTPKEEEPEDNPTGKTAYIPTNLLGISETEFKNTLTQLGFTNVVKDTSGFYSTINAKGTIGYYDPDGDVALNTKIIYRLSLGPYDAAFNKADYEGKTLSEANSVVKKLNNLNAHITLNTTETKDESHKDGTLFDCTVKRSGTNSTVSCKLAKNDTTPKEEEPTEDNKLELTDSASIITNYSGTSYSETENNLKNGCFKGFTNVTYKNVTSDKTVGHIVSVTIGGNPITAGKYAKDVAIVVEICGTRAQ